MVWKTLEGSAGFARFCKALGSFERRREGLVRGIGSLWEALGSFMRLWKALQDFVRL